MATSSTASFLPPYLQTTPNRRFLAATLDLLVNQPQINRFDGYIGRQFYNGAVQEGNYLLEPSLLQQYYQLEAAFVSYDNNQNITATANFLDMLNSAASKDAVISAWNRLVTGGLYSWQGFMDLDKLINYQNYCWIAQSNSNYDNTWYWSNSIRLDLGAGAVAGNILGQSSYTDAAGVTLMPGMIVSFAGTVDSPYNTGTGWIVDGVGTGITLTAVENMISPAFVKEQNNPPDYLTIARNAQDTNLWSRSNFWVPTATVNAIIPILAEQVENFTAPTKFQVADRPIIEFVPMVLYGMGRYGLPPISYFDNFTTNSASTVQGSSNYEVDGYQLNDGDTVVFTADFNAGVRQKVYTVNFVDTALSTQIPRLYPVQAQATSNILLAGLQTIDGYQAESGDRILVTGQNTSSENGIWIVSDGAWTRSSDLYRTIATSNVELQGLQLINGYQLQEGDRLLLTGQTIASENGIYIASSQSWTATNDTALGVLVLYGLLNKLGYYLFSVANQTWSSAANTPVIQLVATNSAVEEAATIILNGEDYGGMTAVFDGSYWNIASQNKTAVNQAPLFDVFDSNGVSYGNPSVYPQSSFTGSALFSYQLGTGVNDPVLGFPLSYGPVGNLNDVIFQNNYVTDSFSYFGNSTRQSIVAGHPHLISPVTAVEAVYDCWQYVDANLELYQNYAVQGQRSFSFTGNLLVKAAANSQGTQLYVDGMRLAVSDYTVSQNNGLITVTIADSVAVSSSSVVFLKILSSSPIAGFWYDPPPSWDHNPLGQNLTSFNMGMLREHAFTVQANANDTSGLATLQLNQFHGVPGNILFPENLSLLPTLLLCNPLFDIDQALRTASEDYTLFKQKFLNVAFSTPGIDALTTKQAVDQVLEKIASSYTSSQPWASSDMTCWGGTQTNYTITKVKQVKFNLSQSYDWSQPNSRQLMVYLNNQQLILNQDYTVDNQLLTVLAPLATGDVVSVFEVANTLGSYIPATPTKLGLAAAYLPQIYTDDTYQTARLVIQGHDGSITECYGDYRDQLLLDYELRVYNNLKVNNQLWSDIIQNHVSNGGRWRSELASSNAEIAPYSPSELASIQQRMFYEWASEYRVNYINSYYDPNDVFTWNWSGSLDKLSDQQTLPGYWRGIYQWFYDSENPNTRPWEMLNLSEQPSWWVSQYGPAPYTGGNEVLWNDIAQGIIRDPEGLRLSTFGPRAWANNSVLSVLPVDSSGTLLNPAQSVVGTFNESTIAYDFSYGDGAPAETAWRRSSVYPFAMLRAQILQNPLFMVGSTWDTNNYLPTQGYRAFRYGTNQLLGSSSQVVLNSVDNSGTAQVNSLLNYSIEYLRRQGQNPALLRTAISNSQAQLIYELGGFSDATDLTVYAAPNNPNDVGAQELLSLNDFNLFLNHSTPVGILNYSGLIISQAPNNRGYMITGYNQVNPYFLIYPPQLTAATTTVGVAPDLYTYPLVFSPKAEVVPYNTVYPDAQSVVNFIAAYGQFLTQNGLVFTVDSNQSQVDWQSEAVQFIKWAITDWSIDGSLSLVLNPSASVINFTSPTGMLNDLTDPLSSLVLDVSGQPVDQKYLDVYRDHNSVTITHQGGGIFGCISAYISNWDHRVVFDNTSAFNDTIYDPISGIRQTRLQISGQKSANWTGSLDSPGFLICTNSVPAWQPNQDYLFGSLVQWKGNNYVANKDTIGSATFQYNSFQLISTVFTNRILPNLSLKATDYSHAYDTTYRSFITDLVNLRNNTIGYMERDWLSGLDIDAAAQLDFYRGWVKQKGSLNAINSYATGSTSQLNTAVAINEEYAIKVGVYGADARTGYADVSLPPAVNTQNPVVVQFVDSINSADTITVQVLPSSLYEKSANWDNNFASSYGNLQLEQARYVSAGPVIPQYLIAQAAEIPGFVRPDENSLFFANLTAMTTQQPQDSILKIGPNGGSFWIANNPNAAGPNQWDVLTFDSKPTGIVTITQISSSVVSLQLSSDIAATANSLVIINYSDSAANIYISGSFQVYDYIVAPFDNGYTIGYANLSIVTPTPNQYNGINVSYTEPAVTSEIYVARSLRANSIGESVIAPNDTTRYVVHDSYGETGYGLTPPYSNEIQFPNIENAIAIGSIAYDPTTEIVWSGHPTAGIAPALAGSVQVQPLAQTYNAATGTLSPTFSREYYQIEAENPNTRLLGSQIVCAAGVAAITAANSASGGSGQIYIAQGSNNVVPSITQILSSVLPEVGGYTIPAIAMSSDASWLYATTNNGSNNASVLVYSLETSPYTDLAWWPNYSPNYSANVAVDYISTAYAIPDAYAVTVSLVNMENSSRRVLIPVNEYLLTNPTTIQIVSSEIKSLLSSGTYSVSVIGLDRYYRYQGAITLPTNGGYGASLSTDAVGNFFAVGAPGIGQGNVAVYQRITENQYPVAGSVVTLENAFTSIASVIINGADQPSYSYSFNPVTTINPVASIQFSSPLTGINTFRVTGMCFGSPQIIPAPNSSDAGFGSSVAIQQNQLVVGSPKTRIAAGPQTNYNNQELGASYVYALDSGYNSVKTIPLSAITFPSDGSNQSLVANGWTIQYSNISTLVANINGNVGYTGVSATVSGGNLNLYFTESFQTTGIRFVS